MLLCQKGMRQSEKSSNLSYANLPAHMDVVAYHKKKNSYRQKTTQHYVQAPHQFSSTKFKPCGKCGKTSKHSWSECPAKDVECRKCHKKGLSAQTLNSVETQSAVSYLGTAAVQGMQAVLTMFLWQEETLDWCWMSCFIKALEGSTKALLEQGNLSDGQLICQR